MEILKSVLVLIGIVITIYKFNRSQATQLKVLAKQLKAQEEGNKQVHLHRFQNSFWQQQLDLYLKASAYAAELTQHKIGSKEYLAAKKEFNILYWGPMSIVEDVEVKAAMQGYSNQLKKYENATTTAEKVTERRKLEQASYQLAKECRASSITRWQLKDFELEDKEKLS